mmetsp:Transcript_45336/g.89294  ORF Transcript_45336/g.89294 Transcript_45336/m.89294 type:complete len:208 (+) Transcript_45336:749-1372(+)
MATTLLDGCSTRPDTNAQPSDTSASACPWFAALEYQSRDLSASLVHPSPPAYAWPSWHCASGWPCLDAFRNHSVARFASLATPANAPVSSKKMSPREHCALECPLSAACRSTSAARPMLCCNVGAMSFHSTFPWCTCRKIGTNKWLPYSLSSAGGDDAVDDAADASSFFVLLLTPLLPLLPLPLLPSFSLSPSASSIDCEGGMVGNS